MQYTFIGDATYALMLYLLYASDHVIRNTVFFVGTNCGGCNLPNKIVMPPINNSSNKELVKYRLRCLKFRYKLKQSIIFAQDHLPFSAPLIDNLSYSVLEDCPNFFSIREERKEITFCPTIRSLWFNFKVGRIYQRYAGHNPWCKKRIITSYKDEILFQKQGLDYERINIANLWKNSSEWKKNFILKVFSIPPVESIKKDIVIFSQPLCIDAKFSEDEVVNIFKPYVDKYGADNIIIKLHPRDAFDYKSAFPGISTLCTKAPQQLLDIMGVKFKTAITVCSSAVSSMDSNCEVIWIGAEIDDRIVKAYGHVKCPCK